MRKIAFRAWDKAIGVMYEYNARVEDLHSDCVLMQYTNLKDSRGKEIYEGDILEVDTEPGTQIVEWKEITSDEGMFDLCVGYYIRNGMCPHRVIGNIYENPELLNKKL